MARRKVNENNPEFLKQLKRDYMATFGTEPGKRVLKDLEDKGYIHRSTFSAVRDRTLLNEGIRYMVVYIKNMLTRDLEELEKLIREGD